MVVCIYGHPCGHQRLDQPEVTAVVLSHAVGNLNDTAHRAATIPAGRCHAQAVAAGEMKFRGWQRGELSLVKGHKFSASHWLQSTDRRVRQRAPATRYRKKSRTSRYELMSSTDLIRKAALILPFLGAALAAYPAGRSKANDGLPTGAQPVAQERAKGAFLE